MAKAACRSKWAACNSNRSAPIIWQGRLLSNTLRRIPSPKVSFPACIQIYGGQGGYGYGGYGYNRYAMNPYGMQHYGMNPYGQQSYG